MGNCQAAEAATVVIQHPGGRVERLYWLTPASEVTRNNPGHYVALITLCSPEERRQPEHQQRVAAGGGGRLTRVRLLRPKDTLVPGHVYRLVTSQEVMKGLRASKQEKARATQIDQHRKQRLQQQQQHQRAKTADHNDIEVAKQERSHQKAAQSAPRPRHWRPSLQSISEASN